MTNQNIHKLQATKKSTGMRLDKFLASNIPDISRSMVKKLIDGGHVEKHNNADKRNVIITNCAAVVKENDIYSVTIPKPSASQMLPSNIPLTIIYEDSELLIIDKPAGLTVHPGAGNHQDTMANALIAHCGASLSGIGGVMRPGIVHRLDKDTSGLIIAAKTDQAHKNLAAQIASRNIKRTYLALCWGTPKPASGRIETNIGRSTQNRKKMAVVKFGGKISATNYTTIEILAAGSASLIECRLETGRTHQIRVHMHHIGHPVIGDQAYGGSRRGTIKNLPKPVQDGLLNQKRQALHSHKLSLQHPKTGQIMEFISQLPHDMAKLLEILKP